jgi:hypothetical protein
MLHVAQNIGVMFMIHTIPNWHFTAFALLILIYNATGDDWFPSAPKHEHVYHVILVMLVDISPTAEYVRGRRRHLDRDHLRMTRSKFNLSTDFVGLIQVM